MMVPKPIEKDIFKEKELLSEYDANKYQRDREPYPSIEEQLDDLYHNAIGWLEKNNQIKKDKYPKG